MISVILYFIVIIEKTYWTRQKSIELLDKSNCGTESKRIVLRWQSVTSVLVNEISKHSFQVKSAPNYFLTNLLNDFLVNVFFWLLTKTKCLKRKIIRTNTYILKNFKYFTNNNMGLIHVTMNDKELESMYTIMCIYIRFII